MSSYSTSPSTHCGTAATNTHPTRDHTAEWSGKADQAVSSATATQPKTYGSGAAYEDACFFFVRLTLSRLSTCSSVCELSMIWHSKYSHGKYSSVICTHEHRRRRSHASPPPRAVDAAAVKVLARPHAGQAEWPCRVGGAAAGRAAGWCRAAAPWRTLPPSPEWSCRTRSATRSCARGCR